MTLHTEIQQTIDEIAPDQHETRVPKLRALRGQVEMPRQREIHAFS